MVSINRELFNDDFAFKGDVADLQFNRIRYYDPTVGRWLSEDPIGFAAGDANLYRYVGNSPTNATDPTGLKRRLCFFWGHGYIETVSSDGDRIFLQFGPGWFGEEGYNVTDYVLPTGFPISEWMGRKKVSGTVFEIAETTPRAADKEREGRNAKNGS